MLEPTAISLIMKAVLSVWKDPKVVGLPMIASSVHTEKICTVISHYLVLKIDQMGVCKLTSSPFSSNFAYLDGSLLLT